MWLGNFDTRLAAEQLRILFDIESVFRRRGRRVSSYENISKLLFAPKPYGDPYNQKVFDALSSRSFRKVISSVANQVEGRNIEEIKSELHNSISEAVIQDTLTKAVELGLLATKDSAQYKVSRPGVGFGSTFEWCVAFCFLAEFSCPAFWGVEVEGLPPDYDVIVHRETNIGYIECKSGKLSNITQEEVFQFLEREQALAPTFSIFLADEVSRDRLNDLVDLAIAGNRQYRFESPGAQDFVSLELEEYNHFIRLNPINCFFVTSKPSLSSAFSELFRFLSLVCDRPMPYENVAAKEQFKADSPCKRS